MDQIKFTILGDGTLRVETDEISSANHRNADELMEFLAEKMGGPVETEKHLPGHEQVEQGQQRKQ